MIRLPIALIVTQILAARVNKVIAGYFDPAVSKQLRGMAAKGDTSV